MNKDNLKITSKMLLLSIYGYLVALIVIILLLLIFPFFLLTIPFDKKKRAATRLLKFGGATFQKLFLSLKLNIYGEKPQAPEVGERRIYIANHGSKIDAAFLNHIPGNIKSISKKSNIKIPVVGWLVALSGYGLSESGQGIGEKSKIVSQIIKQQNSGDSIFIFSEGTRSKNGEVGKLRNGGFKIALQTKSDIYPIVFDTWNVLRTKTILIRDLQPSIKFLKPLKYNEIKDMSHKQLSKVVRAQLVEELNAIRNKK